MHLQRRAAARSDAAARRGGGAGGRQMAGRASPRAPRAASAEPLAPGVLPAGGPHPLAAALPLRGKRVMITGEQQPAGARRRAGLPRCVAPPTPPRPAARAPSRPQRRASTPGASRRC
jgi:hypothetical protein